MPHRIEDENFLHLNELWRSERLTIVEGGKNNPFGEDVYKYLVGRTLFDADNTSRPDLFGDMDPDDPSSRRYVTLRVDAGLEYADRTPIISGDIFLDYSRKEWELSFRSEAIYEDKANTRIYAVCDISQPAGAKRRFSNSAKILVAMEPDTSWTKEADGKKENGFLAKSPIQAFRLALINNVSKPIDLTLVRTWNRFDTFRYLKLRATYATGNGGLSPKDETLVTSIFGDRLDSLRDRLFKSGGSSIFPTNGAKELDPQPAEVGRDVERELYIESQFNDDPQLMTILFSARVATGNERVRFGSAHGIDPNLPRMRSRAVATVYIAEIRKFMQELGLKGDALEEAVQSRVERTILHELGHLLNLPHPWQRDIFNGQGLASDPADKTLMNYGSLYPFGRINTYSRWKKSLAEDKAQRPDWLRDQRLEDSTFNVEQKNGKTETKSGRLKNAGFSQTEQIWIRHAPHDWIAIGERVFTDEYRQPPRIRSINGAARQLELTLDGDVDVAAPRVVHNIYPGSKYLMQPVAGTVLFDPSKFDEIKSLLEASFQTSTLELIVRREPSSWQPTDKNRLLEVAPVALLNYDDTVLGEIAADEIRADSLEVVRQKNRSSLGLMNVIADTGIEAEQHIPLLTPKYLKTFGGPLKMHFTLQVRLNLPNGGSVYSNKVELTYQKKDLSGIEGLNEGQIESLGEILNDPLLPELYEIALNWGKIPPGNILRKDRHDTDRIPAFAELLRSIEGLNIEAEIPELEWFMALKQAVTVETPILAALIAGKKRPRSLLEFVRSLREEE